MNRDVAAMGISARTRRSVRASLFAMALVAMVAGCVRFQPMTDLQQYRLEHPSAAVVAEINRELPSAVKNARAVERSGLAHGRPLTPDEIRLARRVGVAHPEKVRIVVTSELPADSALASDLKSHYGVGARTKVAHAETMGYAIFIHPNYADAHWVYAHELTHVAQFETLGIERFLHDYLMQVTLVGYTYAPLERAAGLNEHLGHE